MPAPNTALLGGLNQRFAAVPLARRCLETPRRVAVVLIGTFHMWIDRIGPHFLHVCQYYSQLK